MPPARPLPVLRAAQLQLNCNTVELTLMLRDSLPEVVVQTGLALWLHHCFVGIQCLQSSEVESKLLSTSPKHLMSVAHYSTSEVRFLQSVEYADLKLSKLVGDDEVGICIKTILRRGDY